MHACTHEHTHACTHARRHAQARTQAHTQARTRARTHACTHARMHAHTLNGHYFSMPMVHKGNVGAYCHSAQHPATHLLFPSPMAPASFFSRRPINSQVLSPFFLVVECLTLAKIAHDPPPVNSTKRGFHDLPLRLREGRAVWEYVQTVR